MPKTTNDAKEKDLNVNNHINKQIIVEPINKPNAQQENLDEWKHTTILRNKTTQESFI